MLRTGGGGGCNGRVPSHVCGCLGGECLASAWRAEWVVDGCRLPVVPERRFTGKRPRCSVRENVSGDFSGNLQISSHTFLSPPRSPRQPTSFTARHTDRNEDHANSFSRTHITLIPPHLSCIFISRPSVVLPVMVKRR